MVPLSQVSYKEDPLLICYPAYILVMGWRHDQNVDRTIRIDFFLRYHIFLESLSICYGMGWFSET